MIKAIDLRKGTAVIYEGNIWIVHEVQKVSKGNWRSYIQARLKNLQTGQLIDQRLRVDEQLESPYLDKKPMEYLYSSGPEQHVLMDLANFEQLTVGADVLPSEMLQYLKPNEQVMAMLTNGQVIMIELPNTVELTVTDTPPGIKGATATNQYKDAVVETGAKVRVPPFIENGEVIRVDTRTGEYLERART
ncbi:MAG: Elongation factor P [Phycisphaerae bacterium]|nr:Elongation factor P [Phycisphaerae bacterium]